MVEDVRRKKRARNAISDWLKSLGFVVFSWSCWKLQIGKLTLVVERISTWRISLRDDDTADCVMLYESKQPPTMQRVSCFIRALDERYHEEQR